MNMLEFDSNSLTSSIRQILGLAAEKHEYWKSYLKKMLKCSLDFTFGLHLAIFIEPYLKFILEGKKTVESRFSKHKVAPYQKIRSGDIILLKRSGGPILGICQVVKVWFIRLNPRKLTEIKQNFTDSLCIKDSSFWKNKKEATYATLMKIIHPVNIEPVKFIKHDRRGWVVLNSKKKNLEIDVF